jgi:hypothetical protein
MKAYRRHVVIEDPKRVVLVDVPFHAGDHVEVLMLAPDEQRSSATSDLKKLLRTTQSLPQVRALSDEEIAAEVAAHRNRQ